MAAGRQIEGQMNALDFMKRERRRPCEYTFFRYIGQRVRLFMHPGFVSGRITDFNDYYTEIQTDDGEIYVGGPIDTSPEE